VVALLVPRIVPTERLRPLQWAGLLIAFAGVAFAFAEGFAGAGSPHQLRGDILALGGGVFWGLTTLVIRGSALATVSAEKTLFYQVAVTSLAAPLLSLALGEHRSLAYSGQAWASLGLQTVIGAFASYLAWMWMLRNYPATQLSSFTFLTPVFGLLFGVMLLHEPLTVQLVLALAGVAIGIVLVNRRKTPARALAA
jgi:drug/metabolite transporter (DMT)-like permease